MPDTAAAAETAKDLITEYLRADIRRLGQQSDRLEIISYWQRTQAILGVMALQDMLTETEQLQLGEEVAAALRIAGRNSQRKSSGRVSGLISAC